MTTHHRHRATMERGLSEHARGAISVLDHEVSLDELYDGVG